MTKDLFNTFERTRIEMVRDLLRERMNKYVMPFFGGVTDKIVVIGNAIPRMLLRKSPTKHLGSYFFPHVTIVILDYEHPDWLKISELNRSVVNGDSLRYAWGNYLFDLGKGIRPPFGDLHDKPTEASNNIPPYLLSTVTQKTLYCPTYTLNGDITFASILITNYKTREELVGDVDLLHLAPTYCDGKLYISRDMYDAIKYKALVKLKDDVSTERIQSFYEEGKYILVTREQLHTYKGTPSYIPEDQ